MIVITLQRDKCIGCGYCCEVASDFFTMSLTDGKSILVGSTDKKGFFTLRTADNWAEEPCKQAKANCPVKIIKVSQTK
ncbi:MAG: ferredoxin [Flavobacteriales bacterium]|nr:ferredoxin [Flavobacteriales bacterium]